MLTPPAVPPPAPGWTFRALIEGFYGPPWSWDDRAGAMRWCHDQGLTHYLYAPKDEPRHRRLWREPYGRDVLDGFERLVGEGTLTVGFGISPGLSFDHGSADDLAALGAKVDQVLATGVRLVALLLDDIDIRPGLGPDHADLTCRLRDRLGDRAELILTPTEYTGTRPTPYLDALAAGVPDDVLVAWTGSTVVCDRITVAEARDRAAALGDRPPLLWDNYPVNDAFMADRMFTGPLRGRDPGLAGACSGYAANPMVQPLASRLALASTAGYLRGEDPHQAWSAALGDLRVFAEACDGEVPGRLVAEVVDDLPAPPASGRAPTLLDDLERWLRSARDCAAPGLAEEVGPWLDQVHAEARAGVLAVKLLRALDGPGDGDRSADMLALALAGLWPGLQRSDRTVMGARCSFRPVMGQDAEGRWSYRREAVTEGGNAVDRLIRHALARMP